MLENIKRQRAGFYLNLLILVLTLVCTILFGMNASQGLFESVSSINGGIFACFILSMVLLLLATVLGLLPFGKEGRAKKGKGFLIDLMRIAVSVLLALSTVIFVGGRIENLGYYFGSDLYLGNEMAIAAVTQSLACIVFFAITFLLSLIAIFFAQERE